MSARGMLENPALFAGCNITPFECVERWLDISTALGFGFPLFHRHTAWMLEKHFGGKNEKAVFNALTTHEEVMDWLDLFMTKRRTTGDRKTITTLPELPPIVEEFDAARVGEPGYLDEMIAKMQAGLKVKSQTMA